MELFDFLTDTEMNRLRQQMGANTHGHFELFDVSRQLTYDERQRLEQGDYTLSAGNLKVLRDKTLAYKNSRVWVVAEQQCHLAQCSHIQAVRHQPHKELVVGTGPLPCAVCVSCLVLLKYQGMDERRLRRHHNSSDVQDDFNLAGFKQQYPFYPL